MPLLLRKGRFLCILAVLVFVSCEKELSCEDCIEANAAGPNKPPIANAGSDQVIYLPESEARLNGASSTDPDNNIAGYVWTKISGPATPAIADTAAEQTTASALVEGRYEFELEVRDADGLFSKDTVVVTVNANEVNAGWWSLQSLPEDDFFRGSNHINFLIGIKDQVFAASKNGSFWHYNPQTNEWKQKGDLPAYMASSNFSVVFSIGNKGYFIGNGTCRQYDVATGEWTTRNNAPVGPNHVDYSVPLVIGNKAYLVGSTNNLVTVYDPATDTYTQKGRFPDEGVAAGFVVNDVGYCVQQDGRCWKYDPLTDSWEQKASMPSVVHYMSGLSLNGYGYIIGDLKAGNNNQNSRITVWRYYPSSDEWKQLDEDYPGQGIYAIKTASLNGIAYVGLGYDKGDGDAIDFWSFQ